MKVAIMASQPGPDSPEVTAFASRMYDAARRGDLSVFAQALPAGLPPNMTNDKGDSLLMLATYHGHPALSRLLLQHGADPNRLNDRGQSPLAGAIFKNEKEVVEVLLEGGADVDAGRPSAVETAGLFNKMGEYGEQFEKQRQKLGKGGQGGEGPGGTKAASELV